MPLREPLKCLLSHGIYRINTRSRTKHVFRDTSSGRAYTATFSSYAGVTESRSIIHGSHVTIATTLRPPSVSIIIRSLSPFFSPLLFSTTERGCHTRARTDTRSRHPAIRIVKYARKQGPRSLLSMAKFRRPDRLSVSANNSTWQIFIFFSPDPIGHRIMFSPAANIIRPSCVPRYLL